ncbi:MAG: GNAT family N-acetyltransferase [Vulcanimicrobiaceae bacterium]
MSTIMDVMIRPASGTIDFQAFRELLAEYEWSLPEDLRIHDLDDELQNIELRYGEPNAAFLAVLGASAIGCVAVTVLDESTAVMKRLYVAPEHRRTGAGRALILSTIDFARSMQYRRIVLDTDRDRLESAYRLYLSFGFKECAPFAGADYACPTYMELDLR